MKRFLSLFFSVVCISAFALNIYAAEAVPKKVLEQTDSIVRIIAEYKDEYSTGTGFVVKNDSEGTFIVTNNHVVEEKPEVIYIFFEEEEVIYAEVVANTSQKDMAVLKLEYSIPAEPLKLASNSAQRGDAVYAAGFPGASDSLTDNFAYRSEDVTITDGIVSAVREFTLEGYGTAVKMLQINAAINSGNSGGPLFNEKGEVIGINTLGIEESQGVFASIDVGELKAFLDSNSIKIQKMDLGILSLVAGVIVGIIFVLRLKKDNEKAKQLIPEHRYKKEEDIIEISVKTDRGSFRLKIPEFKLPKLNTKKLGIAAAVIIVLITAGLHIVTISYAKTEDFVDAENVIVLPTVKYIDPQLYAYMLAANLMTKGEFDVAKEYFESMSGYLYADEMVYETDYRKAEKYADSDDFAPAVTIYRNLARNEYRDAEQKLIETKYRQGMYMYDIGNFESALKVLGEVRNEYEPAAYAFADIQYIWAMELIGEENYLKAYNVVMYAPENFDENDISVIKDYVYQKGQLWYHEKSYDNSLECFETLGDYKDSDKYITIINMLDFFNSDKAEKKVAYLKTIFDFEDVSEILLSNQELASEFLKGKWRTKDGKYDLYMHSDGSVEDGLPALNGYENCYYYIENGEYRVYFDVYDNYKVAHKFEAVSPDSIKVHCYADNNTYILYRQ